MAEEKEFKRLNKFPFAEQASITPLAAKARHGRQCRPCPLCTQHPLHQQQAEPRHGRNLEQTEK